MKVVYKLPISKEHLIPVTPEIKSITLDNVIIKWCIDDDRNLEAVVMEFNGVDLSYTPEGRIDPAPTQIQEQAYRIANFIANCIYMQTLHDTVDPEQTLLHAPEVFAENKDEEHEFRMTPRRMWASLNINYAIRNRLDPSSYNLSFNHSAAHGYYADALRAGSVFQKYELLYKVVEYFFSEEGPALDLTVSKYASNFDGRYTPEFVKYLRELRNKSVHPRARKGHVNPEHIASLSEVRSAMQPLDQLAKLLLKHPTF